MKYVKYVIKIVNKSYFYSHDIDVIPTFTNSINDAKVFKTETAARKTISKFSLENECEIFPILHKGK